ncbi:MAG: DUF134 domain-containing protein [Bacteroidales bacterium]
MPRKKCIRTTCISPEALYYKPTGIPLRLLDEVVLEIDELEAIRLADAEGLYHEDAAKQMGISRQTFGRIVESARGKIAKALINGMAIKINSQNNSFTEKTHNIT